MKENRLVDQPTQNVGGILPLKLQFFGGEPPAEGEPPITPPNGEESPKEPQGLPKTFSQDDVNNLVARESKKATEKLLKELGIEDFENAKDGLAKFKEWQDSQKTEAEKQSEQLKQLEENYNKTSTENADLKAQLSAIKKGVNAEYVGDVVVLAKNLVTDEVDMDKAIEQVLEKYPHFKGQQEPQDQGKPTFTLGTHTKQGNLDAFASVLLGKNNE